MIFLGGTSGFHYGQVVLQIHLSVGQVDFLTKFDPCNGSIVVQEAISTGDPEIVQRCLQSRDYQRHSQRTGDVPS